MIFFIFTKVGNKSRDSYPGRVYHVGKMSGCFIVRQFTQGFCRQLSEVVCKFVGRKNGPTGFRHFWNPLNDIFTRGHEHGSL